MLADYLYFCQNSGKVVDGSFFHFAHVSKLSKFGTGRLRMRVLDEKSAKCKFIDFSHLSWWPDGGRLDILIQRYQKPNMGPKVL